MRTINYIGYNIKNEREVAKLKYIPMFLTKDNIYVHLAPCDTEEMALTALKRFFVPSEYIGYEIRKVMLNKT